MAKQLQIPGGPYVNETTNDEAQIPGGPYLNQTSGGAAGVSLTADKVAITLTGKDATFDVVLGFRPFRAVHATAIA